MIQDDLIDILSPLGTATLSRFLGREKASVFDALGVPINTRTLSEALVLHKGAKIFKDKELRLELLKTVDFERISGAYGAKNLKSDDVGSINTFRWNDNVNSRNFLDIFSLSHSWFFDRDKLEKSSSASVRVNLLAPLHGYQDWVRRKIVNFLRDGDLKRAIVHMPTGAGKTRVATETICDFLRYSPKEKNNVVWMAHSEELCDQACSAFESVWHRLGSAPANVVKLWGGQSGSIDENLSNFIVTSFQTAYRMIGASSNERFELFTKIKQTNALLIIDEAHQSIAPTYKEAIELISNANTKILGLTATPGRSNQISGSDESYELAHFFENNKITIVGDNGEKLDNPIAYLRAKGVLSDYDVEYIEGSDSVSLSQNEMREVQQLLDLPKSVLDRLGKDHARTARIAAASLEVAINKGKQTIVFAPTKDSAIELALYLRFNNCAAAAITGDTPPQERARYIEQYKEGRIKVLTNFGVLTAGFDAPNTNAVVIARPTLSVVLFSQMVGRGLRGPLMGGGEHCLIVDVKDNFPNMPSIDQAFRHFDNFFGG